jgi:hypothetical protein
MDDGDYAESKHLKRHRRISLGLVLGGAFLYALQFGSGYAIRHWAVFIFPLAIIWFAEQLSLWGIHASGHWLKSSNADTILRLLGWIVLITLLVLRLFAMVQNKVYNPHPLI